MVPYLYGLACPIMDKAGGPNASVIHVLSRGIYSYVVFYCKIIPPHISVCSFWRPNIHSGIILIGYSICTCIYVQHMQQLRWLTLEMALE